MPGPRCLDLQQQQQQQSTDSSPLRERQHGTRVVDLENKLTKAQEELKKLGDQLASADVAKVDAEEALEKAKKQLFTMNASSKVEPKLQPEPEPNQSSMGDANISGIATEMAEHVEERDEHSKEVEILENEEVQEEQLQEKSTAETTMDELKATKLEKEKHVELLLEENTVLKQKAEEEAAESSAAVRAKEEQLRAHVDSLEEELKDSKATATRLGEQLAAAEGAKATLEAELRRLRVQTEQWRKAAEAATALLASGDDTAFMDVAGGRRAAAQRCRSMDKHIGGFVGFVGWGSQTIDDESEDDAGGGGKYWKAARSRMFGDLWRKKMQQQK